MMDASRITMNCATAATAKTTQGLKPRSCSVSGFSSRSRTAMCYPPDSILYQHSDKVPYVQPIRVLIIEQPGQRDRLERGHMILKDGRPESSWLEDYPAYAVAQAYRVQRHALDDALREIGLTTPQWGTLECIAKNENISGADMARLYHLTPQTMNTVLQNLEHRSEERRVGKECRSRWARYH